MMSMARDGSRAEALAGSILLVVHDFIARSADELSLAKGDRIELIERDDDFGDGWFLGRHMNNGGTGLFPEVYTTPAPKGTPSIAVPSQRRAPVNEEPAPPPYTAPNNSSASSAQVRHTSVPMQQTRPASSSSLNSSSPLAQSTPSIRTSLPMDPKSSYNMSMQSPVMNETLSVINEHITDMNTPRTSYTNGASRDTIGSMASVYSSQPLNRMSYIAGHETDDEDHHLHTEAEVMAWSPERVAEYLEDNGVERSHCDVFRDQEISGDVLLAMEQSSVFMKEFDLGPVGRRLRTWHKIKALQDETRATANPGNSRSASNYSAGGADDDASSVGGSELGRTRSTSAASALPRGLITGRQSAADMYGRSSTMQAYQQPQSATANRASSAVSPLQTMTSFSRLENSYRPSAHDVRSMNHSRRHSSIGSVDSPATREGASRSSHRKQPSIDAKWQPGQLGANGKAAAHSHTLGSGSANPIVNRQSSVLTPSPSSPGDLDRGYFSSNEVDNRSRPGKQNVLQKKAISAAVSPIHSRTGSFAQQRASAFSSTPTSDVTREPVSPIASNSTRFSDATTAVALKTGGSARTSSTPQFQNKTMVAQEEHPVVTKLEYNTPSSLNAIASSPTTTVAGSDTSSTAPARSPTVKPPSLPFFITKSKVKGLRATSDRVTTNEKSGITSPTTSIPSPIKEGGTDSPARTGSTTPSTETRSFDMAKTNTRTSTGSGNNLMPPPVTTRSKAQRKTKKATSAYTRGLEKKTPAEQMANCDYSGWMKKKSGSLMTTWKPRLFVLKGRRLSYYYSENDTEEKGLIDISFHNVLAAQNEKITGLHAAMTGAAGSPTSPREGQTPTNAQQDLKENPALPGEDNDGLFIFKLTPPRSGRGVTFTKPTVHYFAVNSRQEGRLWMAALMKAVIDREQDGVVTTTYNQKTISLARARARKERPLALQEEGAAKPTGLAELDAGDDRGSSVSVSKTGLGIDVLGGETDAGAERDLADTGAERIVLPHLDDGSSMAPSSMVTGTEGESEVLHEAADNNGPPVIAPS